MEWISRLWRRISNQPDPNSKKDRPFPPKLSCAEKAILSVSYVLFLVAAAYLIEQLCIGWLSCSLCWSYIAFGVLITAVLVDRNLRQQLDIHKARLEDRSEVEALIREARAAGKLMDDEEISTESSKTDEKTRMLNNEILHLKGLGSRKWTEYQVLPLDRLVVDFLQKDELKARARSTLADLKDYAEDSSYRYDIEQYLHWEGRIDEAIEEIKDDDKKDTLGQAMTLLQAELKTLLEHLASYEMNWAEGSARVRTLTMSGVIAIPILVVMGLLPILHPCGESILNVLNWGLLGISGSLTAVLLTLRKSNFVEVGNTEGRKEVRHAILGAILGFVAAILVYSMISGGIFKGELLPVLIDPTTNTPNTDAETIGRSILWAIASGFLFERVFDRMRSTTTGSV